MRTTLFQLYNLLHTPFGPLFIAASMSASCSAEQVLGACRFFITCVPTPWLDNKHTVWGRVSTSCVPGVGTAVRLWTFCLHAATQVHKESALVQVVKGADVVQMIEKVKTDRFDKPFEDVKIVNIDVLASIE